MSRYENMSAGYTLGEAGSKLGVVMPDEIRRTLTAAGIRPTGGTMANPRYNRRHVDELAAIRTSQKTKG